MPTLLAPGLRRAATTIDRRTVVAVLLSGLLGASAAAQTTINTYAGTGTAGYSGDGFAATSAQIDRPHGIGVTDGGDVYIADADNQVVRMVDGGTGDISTVAGGVTIPLGDGSAATAGWTHRPHSVAVDPDGNVFIADTVHHRIRRVDGGTGVITTVAGTGRKGYSGDGGLATSAKLNRPEGVWVGENSLLFVVVNTASLTTQEQDRRTLFQSWGYRVKLIAATESQANFDAAALLSMVAYASEEITAADVGTKLKSFTIGVVNEEAELSDEFGFSSSRVFSSEKTIEILDNTHYITSPFGTGTLTITSANQSVPGLTGTLAAGLTTLAETRETGTTFNDSLAVLDTGAALYGGGTAAGRRVMLPWGGGTFNVNTLNTNGQTIMRRAIEWASTSSTSLYVADTGNHCIRKFSEGGNIETIAGTGVAGYAGDGGAATSGQLDGPAAIAVDLNGVIYVADTGNHCVRSFTEGGNIATYAGTGTAGDGPDGPAGAAKLDSPRGLWLAREFTGGSPPPPLTDLLFVVVNPSSLTSEESARKTQMETWGYTVTLIDESDSQANFDAAVASNAVAYVSEEVSATNLGTKLVSTCIGVVNEERDLVSEFGFDGQDHRSFDSTQVDVTDNTHYVTSTFTTGIRAIVTSSQPLIYAQTGFGSSGAQVLGKVKKNASNWVDATAVLEQGASLQGGGTAAGRRVQLPWGGDSFSFSALNADGLTFMQRALEWAREDLGCNGDPGTLTMHLYIADTGNHRAKKVNLTTDTLSTIAGTGVAGFSGDGAAATSAKLDQPVGIAINSSGDVFIGDMANHRIRKIDSGTGNISTYGGTGTDGYSGNGGAATSAQMSWPRGVYVDDNDDVLVADTMNHVVRTITDSSGVINLTAGTGAPGIAESVAATSSSLGWAEDVTVDSNDHYFIACPDLGWVRKVDAISGVITTVMGEGPEAVPAAPADDVTLFCPSAVTVDDSDNVYVADEGGHRIVKLTTAGSTYSIIAGTGIAGFSGDSGPATSAKVKGPKGIAVDRYGNVFIADTGNHRIRRIDAITGDITTIAGTGTAGYTGDGGAATSATMNGPVQVAVDQQGDLYFADLNNDVIRRIVAGNIDTVIGTGTAGYGGDGGDPTLALLNGASGIGFRRTTSGSLYVGDTENHRVRDVDFSINAVRVLQWSEVNPNP